MRSSRYEEILHWIHNGCAVRKYFLPRLCKALCVIATWNWQGWIISLASSLHLNLKDRSNSASLPKLLHAAQCTQRKNDRVSPSLHVGRQIFGLLNSSLDAGHGPSFQWSLSIIHRAMCAVLLRVVGVVSSDSQRQLCPSMGHQGSGDDRPRIPPIWAAWWFLAVAQHHELASCPFAWTVPLP